MGDRGRYDDRSKNNTEESPPFSRIFVVCSKKFTEEDLLRPFEKIGTIENIHIPCDRITGQSKGVAYIKFSKTSEAAAAIKELHMKPIGNESKSIKVMIACNRNDNNGANNISEDKLTRLFIMHPKTSTADDIKEIFSKFGSVKSVFIQKDKVTRENKGFAYVTFGTFFEAAKAYEECSHQYKPVFATPKDELKRSRHNSDSNNDISYNNFIDNSYYGPPGPYNNPRNKNDSCNRVCITVSPHLPSKYVEMLFNVIPGMESFQSARDNYNMVSKATVTYQSSTSANLAIERLHNFEFPSGEIVTVVPDKNPLIARAASDLKSIVDSFKMAVDSGSGSGGDLVQLAQAIAQASSFIKVAAEEAIEPKSDADSFCSVKLPPPQPMADEHARCVQRCFVVCKPKPPPLGALRDVFRRFGDLIDIVCYPNKTYLFVKYASARSARDAIATLHGAAVCGVTLKVMEADEKRTNDESKRMKIDDD